MMLTQGLLMQKYFKNIEMLSHIGLELLKTLGDSDEKLNLKSSYFVYLSVLFAKEKSKFMKLIDQLPDEKNGIHAFRRRDGISGKIERQRRRKTKANRPGHPENAEKYIEVATICEIMDVSQEYVIKIREDIESS